MSDRPFVFQIYPSPDMHSVVKELAGLEFRSVSAQYLALVNEALAARRAAGHASGSMGPAPAPASDIVSPSIE